MCHYYSKCTIINQKCVITNDVYLNNSDAFFINNDAILINNDDFLIDIGATKLDNFAPNREIRLRPSDNLIKLSALVS